MKTDEFKKILKPLIEKTVREVLLQEGVLSRVVSEVAKGLNQPVLESASAKKRNININEQEDAEALALYEIQKKERIKKLNESVGFRTGVFDNVKDIPDSDSKSPLAGLAPGDAGVDISGIKKVAGSKWKLLAGGK